MITDEEMKSEEHLRRNIEEELACEPSVNATRIGVAVEDGIVTLLGHVTTHAEKVAAGHAAARVLGVKAVVSELEVEIPVAGQVTDEEIARAAVDSILWNAIVPGDRVRVRVENGWLTMEGDVDWHYQKNAAYNAVCNLKGVKGVIDNVVIRRSSVPTTVKTHIDAALKRRFGTRKNHITIETSGDHVTLRGNVPSFADRAEIERVAWTAPGVCHVNNDISVRGRVATRRRPPVRPRSSSGAL